MLDFRIKNHDKVDRCLFDPTYLHKIQGMNALQMAVYYENYELTELILQKSRDNFLQVWHEKYKHFDPLKNRDYINSSKANGVTTL